MRAHHSAPSRLTAALLAVARLAAGLRAAGESRRVVDSLARLDDHMLRDIGLTRFDVDAVRAEPALADGTLILAERAREARRNQRALVRDAQSWSDLGVDAAARRAA